MKKRGVGFACFLHGTAVNYTSNADGASAVVRVHDDGFVTVQCGFAELGQGITTVMGQIAAEELGVLAEDVLVDSQTGGTDFLPEDLGAWSSKSTLTVGPAIQNAAHNAKMQIWEIAAKMLNCEIGDLEGKNRRIWVKGHPERNIGFHEAVWNRLNNKEYDGKTLYIIGSATYFPEGAELPSETGQGTGAVGMACGCHAVEVEIETETGELEIINYYAAHDVGRILNEACCRNQITGGIGLSLGYALGEKIQWRDGKVLNANLIDYKIVTQEEMPQITPILLESGSGAGPYGSKGLGETPTVPVGAALSNAIYDAVGVRLTEMPFTRVKILEAIKKKELNEGRGQHDSEENRNGQYVYEWCS